MHSDSDTRLYTVIVLRKFKDSFAAKCKELRASVRPFKWDPKMLKQKIAESTKMEDEFNYAMLNLFRWCEVHYGEAVIAWVHLKVLRLFVESVLRWGFDLCLFSLGTCRAVGSHRPKTHTHPRTIPHYTRYGLPVDFMAALCEPQGKDMDPLVKRLSAAYEHLGADLSRGSALGDASDGAAAARGGVEGLLEFAPFVSVPIESNLA